MRRSLLVIGTAIGALIAPSVASAATTIVVAKANSAQVTPGVAGTGAATGLVVNAGAIINVWTDPTKVWAAGAIPLWSNANGLIGPLVATAGDGSGMTPGTTIGAALPSLTYAGLTAPIGSLVGEINGQFALLGTSFQGAAWNTGELKLYFWDQYAPDNASSLTVQSTVPEPSTWALMMAGFGILGFGLRRRTSTATRVSFKFA